MSFNNIIFLFFCIFPCFKCYTDDRTPNSSQIQWMKRRSLRREKVSDDVSNDFDNIADKSSVSMLFYIVNFASLIFCQTINYQMFFFVALLLLFEGEKIFGANNLCAF